MPIIVEIKLYSGHERTVLVDTGYGYPDLDTFEMKNDTIAYRIAEIAREELERLRKEKFLLDNPELNIGGTVESGDPF